MPFIRSPTLGNRLIESLADEVKVQGTVELGRFINSKFKDLDDMSIEVAEATANIINADEIVPRILELITAPPTEELEQSLSDKEDEETTSEDRHAVEQDPMQEFVPFLSEPRRPMTKRGKTGINTSGRSLKARNKLNSDHSQGLVEPFRPVIEEAKKQRNDEKVLEPSGPSTGEDTTQPVVDPTSTKRKGKKKNKTKKNRIQPPKRIQAPSIRAPKKAAHDDSLEKDESEGRALMDQQHLHCNEPEQDPASTTFSPPIVKSGLETDALLLQDSSSKTNGTTMSSTHKSEIENAISPSEHGLITQPKEELLSHARPDTERSEASEESNTEVCPQEQASPEKTLARSRESFPAGHLRTERSNSCPAVLVREYAPAFSSRSSDTTTQDRLSISESLTAKDHEEIDHGRSDQQSFSPTLECRSQGTSSLKNQTSERTSYTLADSEARSRGNSFLFNNWTSAPGAGNPSSSWADAANIDLDRDLLISMGAMMWQLPPTSLGRQLIGRIARDLDARAPVVVSSEYTGTSSPWLEYDGEKIYIVPHSVPWQDVRSSMDHPAYLPPEKLAGYQACEAYGFYVWRHDRNYLHCSYCIESVFDKNPWTKICQGCGPKSQIRYCNFQHQVNHIEQHYKECGDPAFVMQIIIDHDTEPSHFFHRPPEIIERSGAPGRKSAALKRQKIYAMCYGGHYTLFDPRTNVPQTLTWPRTHPAWREFNERIERLLNIAFFDSTQIHLIKYLYSLLRELLRTADKWTPWNKTTLRAQMNDEFNPTHRSSLDPTRIPDDGPGESAWLGKTSLPLGQQTTSSSETLRKGPQPPPAIGLKTQIEQMESKFWILRAWRQQHPTVWDWQVRANGYGVLRLEEREDLFDMGPGWTGWGGKKTNMRDPDRGMREN